MNFLHIPAVSPIPATVTTLAIPPISATLTIPTIPHIPATIATPAISHIHVTLSICATVDFFFPFKHGKYEVHIHEHKCRNYFTSCCETAVIQGARLDGTTSYHMKKSCDCVSSLVLAFQIASTLKKQKVKIVLNLFWLSC